MSEEHPLSGLVELYDKRIAQLNIQLMEALLALSNERATKAEHDLQWNREVNALDAEVDRLKAGQFTEEEFQNLCHNFDTSDACRFRAECEVYQRKLFGDEKVNAVRKAEALGECCLGSEIAGVSRAKTEESTDDD